MHIFKIFLLSLLSGIILTVSYFAVIHINRRKPLGITPIAPQIFISSQIYADNFVDVHRFGIRTIIDMRPDGEANDQLPSSEIQKLAKESNINFVYNPVPHGAVPSQAVENLNLQIIKAERPILMYCRSGNRAVRTYALCQASTDSGPSLDEINELAKRKGFDLKDLQDELKARIASRKAVMGGAK